MGIIRKLLFRILGIKSYLNLISQSYIIMISLGLGKKKYPEIFYLKNLIQEGNCCIDIGANVGYYSYFISKIINKNGRLIAIEPIDIFADIWQRNMQKSPYKNYTLFRYALGQSEQEVVMGTPVHNGILHHGMTKVIEDDSRKFHMTSKVRMKNPDSLFEEIERVDFIKVDIEGYEHIVFENFKKTITKHKPIIQAELSGIKNRNTVINILTSFSYSVNVLEKSKLRLATVEDIKNHENDFYFLP